MDGTLDPLGKCCHPQRETEFLTGRRGLLSICYPQARGSTRWFAAQASLPPNSEARKPGSTPQGPGWSELPPAAELGSGGAGFAPCAWVTQPCLALSCPWPGLPPLYIRASLGLWDIQDPPAPTFCERSFLSLRNDALQQLPKLPRKKWRLWVVIVSSGQGRGDPSVRVSCSAGFDEADESSSHTRKFFM